MRRKLFCRLLIFTALAYPLARGVHADGAEPTAPANVGIEAATQRFTVERYCNDLNDLKFEVSVYPKTISIATPRISTSNKRTSPTSRFGFFTKAFRGGKLCRFVLLRFAKTSVFDVRPAFLVERSDL